MALAYSIHSGRLESDTAYDFNRGHAFIGGVFNPMTGLFRGAIVPIPKQVSDLIAWFRADQGITLNGGDVSDWEDQSDEGNDLEQTVAANQPLFNSSDSNFNNQPSLTFDGLTEFIRSLAFSSNLVQPNTIFAVYRFTDIVSTEILVDSNATTNRNVILRAGFNLQLYAGSQQNIHVEDTNTHVIAGLFDGASSDSWRDGTQGTPSSSPGADDLSGVTVGASGGLGGVADTFYDGEVTEVIVYDADVSDADKNLIGNYLATKYGTIWTDI